MHNRYLMSLVAAPLMIAALAMPAFADSTPTTCKDGSTSEVSGRGACSGHGGVLKIKKVKASKEAAKEAAAPAVAAAPAAAATVAAPAAKVEKAATKTAEAKAPTVAASATDPTGATAKCKDGTFSHSKHHGGSCSNHGGVAEFLAK